jgi:transcription factor TFIIIB component B''
VRFADPVTIPERAPQSTPTTNAQPISTPPATQETHAAPTTSYQAPVSNSETLPPHQPDSEPAALSDAISTPAIDSTVELSGSPFEAPARDGPYPAVVATASTSDPTTTITNEAPAQTETQSEAARPGKRAAPATEARPRKAPKRNSTRSNATVQAQLEEGIVPGPSQIPRRPPVARMMATAQDQTENADVPDAGVENSSVEPAAAPKKAPAKRKPRKVKTPAHVNEEEPVEGEEGSQPALKAKKPRKPRQTPAKPRAKKAKKAQPAEEGAEAETEGANAEEEEPESDPEAHEIDPEALSMYTITKQKRYGKTSEREKKMAEIDWDEVKRKRRAEAEGVLPEEAQQTDAQAKEGEAGGSTENAEGTPAADGQASATTRAVQGGLGFRVVNGEIVEDEETLQIDRRAQAQAEMAMQAPVEEENDLTRFHNRTTYINDRKRDEKDRVPIWKSKSDPWTEDETDRFFDALRNWGTDFQIISQLFPGKTRAMIKKKFNREEKLDPTRINAALLGKDPVSMDLKGYASAANLDLADFNKFDSLEHAQSLISESMKDKEEAMRIAVKEAEETERQRAVHEAGKKKGREGAEERRKLAQAKKLARSKGMAWGAGTFGGFGGGGDEEEAAPEA